MSTQEITDYLTKQLFVEKNIVTYRSLSRKFSIHVNEAKNELATFHYNAPFQSQTCRATFLLSGVPKQASKVYGEDYPMEGTSEDIWEEDDGEEVVQTQVTIVNEADLEAAKDTYSELNSIHIYSVSPAPLHDAGLICGPTEFVRATDREKGPVYSPKLGRIVAKGIKMGPMKRKPGAPVAGSSKLKIPEPKGAAATEAKEPTAGPSDKGVKEKEKPKQTGKLQFFTKAKEVAAAKQVKQEDTADSKKLFFSKPAAPTKAAPEKPPPEAKEPLRAAQKEGKLEEEPAKEPTKLKFGPPRGVKRKSSVGLELKKEKTKAKSPENVATTSKAPAVSTLETSRGKRRVVLSDDEGEHTVMAKAPPRRKARQSHTTESTENSEAEREARALMDIDDDQVEKVSRVPSTNASANELDDEDEQDASFGTQDGDVSMEEEVPVKAKPKPRKQKAAVPVGRNGLKKRKITKTRRTKDANGYIVKEDYSDWESVEEGDEPEEAPAKPAPKPKAVSSKKVKKEEVDEDMDADEATPMAKGKAVKESAPAKKAPVKPPAAKLKAAAKGTSIKGKSGQQTLSFFGPKKT